MTLEEKIGRAIEDAGLETVPQNVFGINPVNRVRPYISGQAEREAYMKFMGYERGVLTARIAELNSRADQILYIYLCRINEAYLAVADRTRTTTRVNDSYFYEWLDDLAVQGVAYATRRANPGNYTFTYRWDEIQRTIDICLQKGLDLETAAKVASVGVKAVEKYLRHGIISLDEQNEARYIGADTAVPSNDPPQDLVDEIEKDNQADILRELSEATSSRGASMLARDRIGTDVVRVSAINRANEEDIPGFVKYDVEIQISKMHGTEYTPYNVRLYFERDTPMKAIKFTLAKLSEALSRNL